MKLTLGIIAAASLLAFSASPDCEAVYKTTLKSIEADKVAVLDVVSASVEANEDCVCEIVKAAIIASEADKALVGQIVQSAIVASPDNMRLISQCAIAIAPDAATEVQKVLAKFTPQAGTSYSAKGYSAKSAKGGPAIAEPTAPVSAYNPLDSVPVNFADSGLDPFLSIDPNANFGNIDEVRDPSSDTGTITIIDPSPGVTPQ